MEEELAFPFLYTIYFVVEKVKSFQKGMRFFATIKVETRTHCMRVIKNVSH